MIESDTQDRGLDELDTVLFNNLLKRENETEYHLGPKEPVKLHYQY